MRAVAETAVQLRRVQLVAQEAQAAAQALRAAFAAGREAMGLCTDVYMDRPDRTLAQGTPATPEGATPEGATRAVLRDFPGQEALLLSLEVEREGWLVAQRVPVLRARRWLALGPATARELFPLLPAGVAPALAVRSRRTVLRHPEGWWVCLDEALQRWRTSPEALASGRNELVEAVPALPGAVLALHGDGPSVPAWLTHLLETGARCPDVFCWGMAVASRPAPAPRPRVRDAARG